MPDLPFTISPTLAMKLGAVVIHMHEAFTLGRGTPLDVEALRALLNDPEVIEWRERMQALALVRLTWP